MWIQIGMHFHPNSICIPSDDEISKAWNWSLRIACTRGACVGGSLWPSTCFLVNSYNLRLATTVACVPASHHSWKTYFSTFCIVSEGRSLAQKEQEACRTSFGALRILSNLTLCLFLRTFQLGLHQWKHENPRVLKSRDSKLAAIGIVLSLLPDLVTKKSVCIV